MLSPNAVLLTNAAATWFLAGLIWFVQVVHYPSFARVGPEAFAAYHRGHTTLTTRVVILPMCVELLTALALLLPAYRPPSVPLGWAVAGAALVAVLWASTALLQVPAHNRLAAGGWSPEVCESLCRWNWIRTAGWTARAVLLAIVVGRAMR